jgi:sulfite reductase (NADPH) hemoprotein beta-component
LAQSAVSLKIYGTTYLPRQFKIAIAVPSRNDVAVYAHDLGFVAIVEEGAIVGYDVLVGGGMGMTHRQPATFPRLGDHGPLGQLARRASGRASPADRL